MSSKDVSTALICKNILGESCFWDPRINSLIWTDIEGKKIWKLNEKNLIISPISAKSKTQGYMVLCNKETRKGVEPFNSLDLDLLTALCNQAAVAMENAKLFKDITKEKQFNESILGSIASGCLLYTSPSPRDS